MTLGFGFSPHFLLFRILDMRLGEVHGGADIESEIKNLRHAIWTHVASRKHSAARIFFGGENEIMLFGDVVDRLKADPETDVRVPWAGRVVFAPQKEDEGVKMQYYQVYLVCIWCWISLCRDSIDNHDRTPPHSPARNDLSLSAVYRLLIHECQFLNKSPSLIVNVALIRLDPLSVGPSTRHIAATRGDSFLDSQLLQHGTPESPSSKSLTRKHCLYDVSRIEKALQWDVSLRQLCPERPQPLMHPVQAIVGSCRPQPLRYCHAPSSDRKCAGLG